MSQAGRARPSPRNLGFLVGDSPASDDERTAVRDTEAYSERHERRPWYLLTALVPMMLGVVSVVRAGPTALVGGGSSGVANPDSAVVSTKGMTFPGTKLTPSPPSHTTNAPSAADNRFAVRREVWLAASLHRMGRLADAEAAYERALSMAVGADSLVVRRHLQEILEERREAGWIHWWVPRPFRTTLIRLLGWKSLPDVYWSAGVILVLVRLLARRRKGARTARIEVFAKDLPQHVRLNPERRIADYHRKMAQARAPVGVLVATGLKLPTLATVESDELVKWTDLITSKELLRQLARAISDFVAPPRFLITGHVEGTVSAVRFVVSVKDRGKSVRDWDSVFPYRQVLDEESKLACEVVFSLSEFST